MGNLEKSYSFLIAALLCVVIFTFATVITLTLFANADRLSHSSINRTIALQIAQQKISEQNQQIAEMSEREIVRLEAAPVKESAKEMIRWNGAERQFIVKKDLQVEPSAKGFLFHIKIEVDGITKAGEEEMLILLETMKYVER